MVRKTKANLEFENRDLKRKNFGLKKSLDSMCNLAIGLTVYAAITTIVIILIW